VTDRPTPDLASLPGVEGLHLDGPHAAFTVDDAHLPAALQLLIDQGLRAVTTQPPTLEELFLSSYGHTGNGQGNGPGQGHGSDQGMGIAPAGEPR